MDSRAGQGLSWPASGLRLVWEISGDSHIWCQTGAGMTFLLPYILFVILIASTGVIEEMALGRAAKGGPIIAFGNCTEMRTGNAKVGNTIGWIPVLGSLAMAIGYTVIVGWIFKYTFLAITGQIADMGQDMDVIGGVFGRTAAAFGNNFWLVIAVLITAVIMARELPGNRTCQWCHDAAAVCVVCRSGNLYFYIAGSGRWISLYIYD